MTKKPEEPEGIDKLMGIAFPWSFSMFLEFHPFFWGIGYLSADTSTAITFACFTLGVEY